MDKKQKRVKTKRCIWSAAQMDLLLEVWEDKIHDLRRSRKNSHVLEEMRAIFMEHGFMVATDDIKVRINNLTARYKKEKIAIGPSGGSPSVWPYYNSVHRILGSFRIHNVSDVVEESILDDDGQDDGTREEWLEDAPSSPYSTVNDEEDPNGSDIPPTPSSSSSSGRSAEKKRKGVNLQHEMLNEFKRNNSFIETEFERLRETDEKLLKLEEERNLILQDMTESTKELNEAIIKFLSK